MLSQNRQLELRGGSPLQVDRVDVDEDTLTIGLKNATRFARLHVFATRFRPAYSAFGSLSKVRDAEPFVVSVGKAKSAYIAGRNIGDEYRYIIDRQYAKKYPGNMLERPSLLLNPWAIRTTETSQQHAAPGDDFSGRGTAGSGDAKRDERKAPGGAAASDFANLDFLPEATAVMVNLTPSDDGEVKIERELFGANQHVHIVACDPTSTVYRAVSLPEPPMDMQDLRLARGLGPNPALYAAKTNLDYQTEG